MSARKSAIAQTLGRGYESTAALCAAAPGRPLSPKEREREDRILRGDCATCGTPLEDSERGLVIKGKTVINCRLCRRDRKDREPMNTLRTRIHEATEINVAKSRFENNQQAGAILVVGILPRQLQAEARNDKRVRIWSSQDLGAKCPTIPSGTAIVLCTRHVSHGFNLDLIQQAKSRGIFMFSGLLGSGEIRRNLTELLKLHPASIDHGVIDDEDDNLPTEPNSAEVQAVVNAPGSPFAGLVAPAPAALTKAPPTTTPKLEDLIDSAVGQVGEAIAALTLVNEQLQALRSNVSANAEAQAKLQQLKSLLGSI